MAYEDGELRRVGPELLSPNGLGGRGRRGCNSGVGRSRVAGSRSLTASRLVGGRRTTSLTASRAPRLRSLRESRFVPPALSPSRSTGQRIRTDALSPTPSPRPAPIQLQGAGRSRRTTSFCFLARLALCPLVFSSLGLDCVVVRDSLLDLLDFLRGIQTAFFGLPRLGIQLGLHFLLIRNGFGLFGLQ